MSTNNSYINTNVSLGDLLHTIASCYRYLGPEYRLKVMAYTTAARTIHGLDLDIGVYESHVENLFQLKGMDEEIALEIISYLKTGKMKVYERLKKEVPIGLLELMDIRGFGPATIKSIHEKLRVNNRDEMIIALLSGRLASVQGMGEKKIEDMKRGLKLFKEVHSCMTLWGAMETGATVLRQLQALPGVKEALICGSLRRKKDVIADIDIVAKASRNSWENIIQTFCGLPFVHRVISAGGKRISVLLDRHNIQVDIHLVHEHEFVPALLYLTGSKEHNILLKKRAEEKGLRLEEYGVFEMGTGNRLPVKTEEEIYHVLELEYIPPELREGRGEIETAGKHRLPTLIEENDIRGDMQVHSSWSNNKEDIETLARRAIREYPAYEYIVITDLIVSQPGNPGLQPEEILNQFAEIDHVNSILGRSFVKKGIDVPVLENGSLGLPDELLLQFEWVTASIFHGIDRDNTDRLIKACENPYVHCLNHPGGRRLGKTNGWTVNWTKLINKAASTGTCLAINGQPDILDLKDVWVKAAIEKGVRICIGTDASDADQFDFMQTGVAVARRGWCNKENVLNTRSWAEVEYYKQYKQSILKPDKNQLII